MWVFVKFVYKLGNMYKLTNNILIGGIDSSMPTHLAPRPQHALNLPQIIFPYDSYLQILFFICLINDTLCSNLHENTSYKLNSHILNNKNKYTQVNTPRTQNCTL